MNFLYNQGTIEEPLFSMGLRSYQDYSGSFVDVGFVDTYAMATGNVGYVDVS